MPEFSDVVATMRGGLTDRLASAAWLKVVEAAVTSGESAAITVKLIIKPMKNGDGEYDVDAKIGIKFPEIKVPTAIYWVNDKFQLVRSDPRQMNLLDRTEPQRQDGDINQVGRGNVLNLQANTLELQANR